MNNFKPWSGFKKNKWWFLLTGTISPFNRIDRASVLKNEIVKHSKIPVHIPAEVIVEIWRKNIEQKSVLKIQENVLKFDDSLRETVVKMTASTL